MDVNKITLGYWSTKGLGSASRQMIIYAGVPLIAKIYKVLPKEENNQIIYEGSSWHDNDKIDLKKKNSLINLPYLKYFKDDKDQIENYLDALCRHSRVDGFFAKVRYQNGEPLMNDIESAAQRMVAVTVSLHR